MHIEFPDLIESGGGVRLCHGGQNVFIVHNCLFNQNIPVGAEPSPGSPHCLLTLCPDTEGEMASSVLFENCPAVKVAVTFSQCFPGLISSVRTPALGTVSSPSPCPLSPPSSRDTPEPVPHVTDGQAVGYSSVSFHLALLLCLPIPQTHQKSKLFNGTTKMTPSCRL